MSRDFLSEILAHKRQEVARIKNSFSASRLHKRAHKIRKIASPHRLLRTLESQSTRLKIIAEFKRRSPSAGIVGHGLSPAEIARRYERGGACAISVLTDEEYFGGSLVDLRAARSGTSLPILRKDFIIDPIQIYEAAIASADAVLLIAAALDDVSLGELRRIAEEEVELDALVEVHTSGELRRAVNAGAKIIGVNNRDLATFQVSLETSERLIAEAPRDKIMISESGLQSPKSLRHLRALGFRGFLIGETLMRAANSEKALRDFVAGVENPQPVQIKICGITSLRDAKACVELGAHMIGLNFYRQSPRYVDPQVGGEIVSTIPSNVHAVGVFADSTTDEVRKAANIAGVRSVQLHGNFSPDAADELAREFQVIRAFATNVQFRIADISAFPNCDVLIDAHHPDLKGGTGLTCDWPAARAALPFARFLILSGGLSPKNVDEAIRSVRPHAVDVCSSVESAPGVKNHRAIKDFVAAVRTTECFGGVSLPQ